MSDLLEVRGVSKSFRGLKAVSNASFAIPEGSINALIGPNGAGKTTIFNMVAGVFPPDAGKINFLGKEIQGLRPDQVCAAGIGRTFQIVKPFAGLSVLDNVIVGALLRSRTFSAAKVYAAEIIEKLGLGPKRDLPASSLTLPDRKRLEVARALATRPKLLLLDEVMAGLRPTECDQMVEVFRGLNKSDGLTILLVEQNVAVSLKISQRAYVLENGRVVMSGSGDELLHNDRVRQAYLGL